MPKNKIRKKAPATSDGKDTPRKVIKLFWIFVVSVMVFSLMSSLIYMAFYF